ncbi:MAG: YCF48-related protein [Dechloromonas sp.]|nr:YCF48-related protein [Dechloromonas sp.]
MTGIQAERLKPVQRYDISQAIAANGEVVVVGTQTGSILRSTDQGLSWSRLTLGQASLVDIAVCHDKSFVAIDHYRQVWFAGPDGATWQAVKLERPRTPLAVTCDPQGGWWVAGINSVIAGSRDQGKTWQITDLGEDAQLTTIQFIDAEHGVALGEFGMQVWTHDGGASWAKGPSLPDDFYPYAALFSDSQQAWVAGIAGQMLHTRDGGKSWQKQSNETGASLNRLFMHEGMPYGAGNGGVIARLQGDRWRNVPYSDPQPLFLGGAAALPGQSAVVVGGPGGLLRTVSTAKNN